MEDRIKVIRVKDDDTCDALVYAINYAKVMGGSIERCEHDDSYALAVLTEDGIISASFKDGECEGFTFRKDKVRPEKHALIVLMAGISDNRFDSVDIDWDIYKEEFIFAFNREE